MIRAEEKVWLVDLATLPLFAQSLVACRLARRAVLAMLSGEEQKQMLDACDSMESIGFDASKPCADYSLAELIARVRLTHENQAALVAVGCADEAIIAAQKAAELHQNVNVASITQRCVESLCQDPRLSAVQVLVLLRSDIDQIKFACVEARIGMCEKMSKQVLSRLAPCHPFTLVEPRRNIEDDFR